MADADEERVLRVCGAVGEGGATGKGSKSTRIGQAGTSNRGDTAEAGAIATDTDRSAGGRMLEGIAVGTFKSKRSSWTRRRAMVSCTTCLATRQLSVALGAFVAVHVSALWWTRCTAGGVDFVGGGKMMRMVGGGRPRTDAKNAFNAVHRETVFEAITQDFPQLWAWAELRYGVEANFGFRLGNVDGSQQGSASDVKLPTFPYGYEQQKNM
ncbi:hypothetical protein CYMTET_56793 [Cymbomonas tetramitiformis]|uniref:Uncharacterized protein n=1 Tax=Cymbomonas tetramitiformis TaxID=36881 RepID=A0AAE0BBH0_9CHLO|nr:hypothetical protein CYMTET_56793 [Cymbomonas tetramitiformis]